LCVIPSRLLCRHIQPPRISPQPTSSHPEPSPLDAPAQPRRHVYMAIRLSRCRQRKRRPLPPHRATLRRTADVAPHAAAPRTRPATQASFQTHVKPSHSSGVILTAPSPSDLLLPTPKASATDSTRHISPTIDVSKARYRAHPTKPRSLRPPDRDTVTGLAR